MTELVHLVLALLLAGPEPKPPPSRITMSEVPCSTVEQCWLDEDGKPIARPKRLRGKAPPRGDCHRNLRWLRNRLVCLEDRCAAYRVGDKC